MRSNPSSSSKELTWESPIVQLSRGKPSKSVEKLTDVGITTLKDLLWILPIRSRPAPSVCDFSYAREGELFKGQGEILNIQSNPNYRARGRGRALLYNIKAYVKDAFSEEIICLRWFNSYSSISKKLKEITYIEFLGEVTSYQGQKQIVSPTTSKITTYTDNPNSYETTEILVQYPTVNSVAPNHIAKIISKIPKKLWREIPESLPEAMLKEKDLLSISESFSIIHGVCSPFDEWSEYNSERAKERLIYEEFYRDQLKIIARRSLVKAEAAPIIESDKIIFNRFQQLFPYKLTKDQIRVCKEIEVDLASGTPMMRLLQGDVGCGKTTVAIYSAILAHASKKQTALMCPTESLAFQHFTSISSLLALHGIKTEVLLGSTKTKDKNEIYKRLSNGDIDLIIGTHSLIQDKVSFKDLGLVIIDEQHKFGVNQRLKLANKSKGVHSLIMTATPIPRSLSLTQFGDLDISTITVMPSNRKGQQTKIITPNNFSKFLSFMKTRLSMGEQAYVVVPAIEENPDQDFVALEEISRKFKTIFSEYRIGELHGKMKPEEKTQIFQDFSNHNIDIIIATSVVEVGINVINASVMAILNPERFGLSSLHQLRGRVGRGEKPGFCFLVIDKETSKESLERLQVIEKSTDGFEIAEHDLKIRGEGDLFGTNQSGVITRKKIASIIEHGHILNEVKDDLDQLIKEGDQFTLSLLKDLKTDPQIISTV